MTGSAAPPATRKTEVTVYGAPHVDVRKVPSAGTLLSAANLRAEITVYGCGPPNGVQSFTARGAPPAIRYTVCLPETCTNVPSLKGTFARPMLPAAAVAPSIASESMLIVTPPYVALWPPEYWCRRWPTQNPEGRDELFTE